VKKIFFTALIVLLSDQILKIWVKSNMLLWEKIEILNSDKFTLLFIENNGAAFGFLGESGELGKVALTVFRIIIVTMGVFYIKSIHSKISKGALISLGLIIGGAVGNIIDSSFYGLIFNESGSILNSGEAAKIFSDVGYAPLFQGKVVDMFSFQVFTIELPNWLAIPIPFSGTTILSVLEGGDNKFTFFQPIFNIADASITIGVFILLVFYRKEFR